MVCLGQLYLGVHGGKSVSWVTFSPTLKQLPLLDQEIDYGLGVKYYDLQYVGFHGEANFSQRGYVLPLTDTSEYKRINNYLEIPIFMQVRIENKGFFIHLNVGCYSSYLISTYQGNNTYGFFIKEEYDFNILKDNRFDYGLAGGLGFGFETRFGVLQLDARFTLGFGDIYKHNFKGNPTQSPARMLGASLSYFVNLTKLSNNGNKLTFNDI